MNDLGLIEADLASDLQTKIICGVSTLLTTFDDHSATHFAEALESVFAQSTTPDQLVIVINGPNRDHERVVAQYQHDPRIPVIDVVRLPHKTGLADALNAGLAACTGVWIMHGDEINRRDRLAIQLDYIAKYPDVDIFSSWCEEFVVGGPERQIKASAVYHTPVVAALRWRNVVVHSSTMIRAQTLRDIGGYRDKFSALEHYDLYVRLVLAGAIFRVIPAELVSVRIDREGGIRFIWNELYFRIFCWRRGFLNARQFFVITLAHLMFQLATAPIRNRLYRLVRVSAVPRQAEI